MKRSFPFPSLLSTSSSDDCHRLSISGSTFVALPLRLLRLHKTKLGMPSSTAPQPSATKMQVLPSSTSPTSSTSAADRGSAKDAQEEQVVPEREGGALRLRGGCSASLSLELSSATRKKR